MDIAILIGNNLLKLSEKDKVAKDVVKIIANNFSKFPENVRNELLLKLSEKDKVAKDVSSPKGVVGF